MKLQVAAAACSICSIVAMSSGLNAEELRLSEGQLDMVTAGATSLLAPGGRSSVSILNPPAPEPPPTSNPTPTAPPPNQVIFTNGGTQLSITLPVTSGNSAPEIFAVFNVTPTSSIVGGATQFTNDGGGDAILGGITAVSVSSQSN